VIFWLQEDLLSYMATSIRQRQSVASVNMATTEVCMEDAEAPQTSSPASENSRLLNTAEAPLGDLKESTRKEQAVAGLAVVSFAASITSILFASNPMVYVSGIIGATLSPYVAVQQRKITDIDALEETTSRMKEEVAQLEAENNKLEASVKQLQLSVSGLKATKDKLETLQSVQGKSIAELEKQLEESRKIAAMQKDSLSGDILNNIMTVVLAADDDGDMMLSDAEIDEVTKNLESLQGVDFNDAQLKKLIISKGRDIPGKCIEDAELRIIFPFDGFLSLLPVCFIQVSWTWSRPCWNQKVWKPLWRNLRKSTCRQNVHCQVLCKGEFTFF
jgi:myosin heavy subunit